MTLTIFLPSVAASIFSSVKAAALIPSSSKSVDTLILDLIFSKIFVNAIFLHFSSIFSLSFINSFIKSL